MTDPNYVQLAPRLVNGMCADVEGGSGWSIAGLDVRKFPEDELAARFVRAKLNSGVLEPASRAEWDEVHNDDEVLSLVGQFKTDFQGAGSSGWQEAKVQRLVQKARESLEANRLEDVEAALDALDDERRANVLDEQDDLDLGTDDPEVQVGRSTGQRPRRRPEASKKASKKRGAKKDEEENE